VLLPLRWLVAVSLAGILPLESCSEGSPPLLEPLEAMTSPGFPLLLRAELWDLVPWHLPCFLATEK